MEINLSLDEHGRTRCDANDACPLLDYSTKAIPTTLMADDNDELTLQLLDKLLLDAEIADCALLPRTFWMSVSNNNNNNSRPRCLLEQLALQIFQHHVGINNISDGIIDPETSGAEWWVQIRPSPPGIGRYAVLDKDETVGITFHWDKDEDLRLLAGGNLYIHPHLSTVTYLTSQGAPTIVFNRRIHNITGEWILNTTNNNDAETTRAVVSWPKTGKHLRFDGRYLHAAPSELIVMTTPGVTSMEQQQPVVPPTIHNNDSDDARRIQRILTRRHRRVTFLVNIWINYKPFNVHPFPETMLDKLTGVQENFQLFSSSTSTLSASTTTDVVNVQVKGDSYIVTNSSSEATDGASNNTKTTTRLT
jgi:hypothetical protein